MTINLITLHRQSERSLECAFVQKKSPHKSQIAADFGKTQGQEIKNHHLLIDFKAAYHSISMVQLNSVMPSIILQKQSKKRG